MNGWTEFWQMGGYGFYVWSAYGVAVIVLVSVWVAPVLRARAIWRRLSRREQLAARGQKRWSAA